MKRLIWRIAAYISLAMAAATVQSAQVLVPPTPEPTSIEPVAKTPVTVTPPVPVTPPVGATATAPAKSADSTNQAPTTTTDTLQEQLVKSSASSENARENLSAVIVKNSTTANLTSSQIESIEDKLILLYKEVQRDCSLQLIGYESQSSRTTRNQAHLNAIGALIALIGGVTVYAPAKTVLMGIGISSAGGSNSVIGDLASNQHDRTTLSQQHIDDLKSQYTKSIAEYKDIKLEADPRGTKRFYTLMDAQAGCMGLSTVNQSNSGK
jgi:hypothetical protein